MTLGFVLILTLSSPTEEAKWILRSKAPTIPQVMKFCSVANEPTVTTASPFIEMRYFISAVLA